MAAIRSALAIRWASATPERVARMLEAVLARLPARGLAGHYHDTAGRALENIATSLGFGGTRPPSGPRNPRHRLVRRRIGFLRRGRPCLDAKLDRRRLGPTPARGTEAGRNASGPEHNACAADRSAPRRGLRRRRGPGLRLRRGRRRPRHEVRIFGNSPWHHPGDHRTLCASADGRGPRPVDLHVSPRLRRRRGRAAGAHRPRRRVRPSRCRGRGRGRTLSRHRPERSHCRQAVCPCPWHPDRRRCDRGQHPPPCRHLGDGRGPHRRPSFLGKISPPWANGKE